MKLDILAFGAHPDDVEMSCSGTIMKQIDVGKTVGVIDLTRGELGTRGTPEIRMQEAAAAAKIMGVSIRENMGMRDGFFLNDEEHQMQIIRKIRKYQPDLVYANAVEDRHPDHGRAADLIRDAAFKSGLRMIKTVDEKGDEQAAWRPKKIFYYNQDRLLIPSFVVDISGYWERKLESIRAYKSQFWDPNSTEPESYISTKPFWQFLEGRAREFGHYIGTEFGESFVSETVLKINDPLDLV
jgi:bacillithiol biosynthesis deacetylase BshB1